MSSRGANNRTLKARKGQTGRVRVVWNPRVQKWNKAQEANNASESKRGDLVLLLIETGEVHFKWAMWVLFDPKQHRIGKLIELRAEPEEEQDKKGGRR